MKRFMCKVGCFFKKIGRGIANGFKAFCNLPWNQPVRPVIAWSLIGGVLAVSVALMLIFWL